MATKTTPPAQSPTINAVSDPESPSDFSLDAAFGPGFIRPSSEVWSVTGGADVGGGESAKRGKREDRIDARRIEKDWYWKEEGGTEANVQVDKDIFGH